MRTTMQRVRRMVVLGLTTGMLMLPASPALAAQVFSQFDALTTHIYQIEGQPQSIQRPAHVRIRVTEPSRELTAEEEQGVISQVPDPLNELCPDDIDAPKGEADCAVTEMETALEERIVGSLEQIPGLSYDEVSVHVSIRRDGNTTQQMMMLGPLLLVPGALLRRRRRGQAD